MKYFKVIAFNLIIIIIGATIYYFVVNRSGGVSPETHSTTSQTTLSEQTNSVESITLKAAPKDLSNSATSWDFEIVLDTHTGSLDQDLAKQSSLVDDKGNQYTPTAWEGDPPGGHHRKGVLKFNSIIPKPSSIELRINNVDGDKSTTFKWSLNQ